jgi:hypothetical protein
LILTHLNEPFLIYRLDFPADSVRVTVG